MATSAVQETPSSPKTTYTMKAQVMTPLKERPPRVIVEVSETDLKAAGEHAAGPKHAEKATTVLARSQREAKISILNSSSLEFQVKSNSPADACSRVMNFDCVVNGDADQLVRWQMSALVDQLLISGRNNCCLLRISPLRSAPTLQILSHVLIPEINKRLGSPDMSPLLLYAIRLEFYDVRKYDVVNMVLRAAPKNKPRHHLTFRNTWELLHWVQETYPSHWALGAGHECLDLKFIFIRDRSGTKVRVKLSIVQFYLSKMDVDMAAGLRNFLENAGANNSARIKHSILTDYLREYFFSPDNWHIWMIFKVPTNKSGTVVSEMLTMASAAYAGVQGLIDGKLKSEKSALPRPDLDGEILKPVINYALASDDNKRCTTVKSSASNTAAQIALRFRKREKQSLSHWYRQMDEKFLNVLLTMQAYYGRKNKSNKSDPSGDGKSSSKNKERREFISTVRNPPRESPIQDYALHTLSVNYKQAVDALHTLIQQIERSPFARQLSVLIHMKNNELLQHLANLRDKASPSASPPTTATTKTKRSENDETSSLKTKTASSN